MLDNIALELGYGIISIVIVMGGVSLCVRYNWLALLIQFIVILVCFSFSAGLLLVAGILHIIKGNYIASILSLALGGFFFVLWYGIGWPVLKDIFKQFIDGARNLIKNA